MEIEREKDEERFGAVCPEALDLVENFCAMHLGVNLRKAFLDGVKTVTSVDPTDCTRQRDNPQTDVVAHELLGKWCWSLDISEEMCATEPGTIGNAWRYSWTDRLEADILYSIQRGEDSVSS